MNEISNNHKTVNEADSPRLRVGDVGGSVSFTIRDTECNSKIFGDCEICGKPVVQVHHQIRWRDVVHPITGEKGKRQISDAYGHYQCLLSVR
jgi:siroheme synthase (precorrin-2 oxidase/ferrochelatase)